MKIAFILSVAALLLVVLGLVCGLLYAIDHNRELAARDLQHAEELAVMRGRVEEMSVALAATREELVKVNAWSIAIYGQLSNLGIKPPDFGGHNGRQEGNLQRESGDDR